MVHVSRENIPVDVLEEIATLGEGYKTEFKATLPSPPLLAKTLCAFLNTKGGNLFVGINDSSLPIGVINKDYEITKLEKALPLLTPAPEVEVKLLSYKNCEILLIEVKEGTDKPYYVRNGQKEQAYTRAGASNLPANKRALKRFLDGHGTAAGKPGGLKKDEKTVYDLFERDAQLKVSRIRESLNYSKRRVKKTLERLVKQGFLIPSQNEKNVYYRARNGGV